MNSVEGKKLSLLLLWPLAFEYSPDATEIQQPLQLGMRFSCTLVVPDVPVPLSISSACRVVVLRGVSTSSRWWQLRYVLRLILYLRESRASARPDVILAASNQLSSVSGAIASKVFHCPWVWLCWDYPFGSRYRAPGIVSRVAMKVRQAVLRITVGTSARVALFFNRGGLSFLNLPQEKLVEIGNGVLFTELESVGRKVKKRPGLIVSLGNVSDDKGAPFLVEAFRKVIEKDNSTVLRFIGAIDAGMKEQVDGRKGSEDVAGRLEFLGDLPFNDAMMAAAEGAVGVCAYRGHDWLKWNQVLKIGEYQALGLAVVATVHPGTTDLVTDDIDGILVEGSDPEQFAEAILRLIRDDALRRRLIKAGRERAAARDWDLVGRKLAAVIHQVAGEVRP
jgi:glycosyltransferase involved in cell wall biosynthesis